MVVIKESKDKIAVLAFGRMNPITIGHKKLIDTVRKIANDNQAEPIVYLSHTQDSKKNPLSYEDKIYFAKKAFGDIIKESNVRTIVDALKDVYSKGYNKLIYVGGSDRIGGEEDITSMLKRYNGQPNKAGDIIYNFDSIDFIDAGDRDSDSDDLVTKASASLARQLASEGDLEGFKELVPLNDSDAEAMYNDVRAGLRVKEKVLDEGQSDVIGTISITRNGETPNPHTAFISSSNNVGVMMGEERFHSSWDLNSIDNINVNFNGDWGKFNGNYGSDRIVVRSSEPNKHFKFYINTDAGKLNVEFVKGSVSSQDKVEVLIANAFNDLNDSSLPYHGVAEVLANAIGTNIKISKLETKDGAPISSDWVEAGKYGSGRGDKTPKTDLISSDGRFRISLKKDGGSQLMSAKLNETSSEALATLNAAISLTNNEYKLEDILNVEPEDGEVGDTFNVNEVLKSYYEDESLRNIGGSIGDIKRRTSGTDAELEQTRKINDISSKLSRFANKLQNLCNNDARFKEAFMREASTGEVKFGADTVSTANCWFVYTAKDTEFYPDWSDFYNRYLSKHKLQIKCAFKSAGSGSVPWISVRVIEGN